ncbi:MAG: TetR/AcrR family transcriptional regulator [Pseudomonadota bacterium]
MKEPTRHHHGNLKQALLDYAMQAAGEGELESLSLRKASRDLGVSPGAAYRHFADRDSLMRTVAQNGFDMLAERFEGALPFNSDASDEDDARRRFVGLASAYVTFSQEHPSLWRLMFGPYGLSPRSATARPSTYDWLGKSLHELAKFGVIHTPDAPAQFFAWTAIHGLSDLMHSPAVSDRNTSSIVHSHCCFILDAMPPTG